MLLCYVNKEVVTFCYVNKAVFVKTKQSNIRDVAREAGVSIATVSRILNGNSGFNDATKQNVENAISDLNYRRAKGTLSLSKAAAVSITLVISDIDLMNPFFWELIKGFYDTLDIHSCSVNLRIFQGMNDTGDGLADELKKSGADGVVFISSMKTDINVLKDAGDELPVLFVDRLPREGDLYSVVSDNHLGSYQAAKYLVQLGHQRIAYVGGPENFSTERERRAGFLQGLKESALTVEAENLLEGGFERLPAHLAIEKRLKSPFDFTAVFAANDLMAFGVKEALDQAGLKVPEDISLMGYDNIMFSTALGLTTVDQRAYEIGRNALLLLLDYIHKRRTVPKHILVSPGLIIRKSCRRLDS